MLRTLRLALLLAVAIFVAYKMIFQQHASVTERVTAVTPLTFHL
jgi:hypothetical protein